jgi:hypothetical protein
MVADKIPAGFSISTWISVGAAPSLLALADEVIE